MLKRAHSNHHSLTLHGGANGCCQVVVCPGAETSLSETDTELESIPGIELALPSSLLRNLLKQCGQEKEKKWFVILFFSTVSYFWSSSALTAKLYPQRPLL